ncbi:MAG: isocitrate lyase/phosphoenolpyruvate mutase family protein [Pseudomonadota bacterium]
MSQIEKAAHFAEMHQQDNPVVLYNIWDSGGAKALVEVGAPAVATGSWSIAAAHGFDDGEAMPLHLVLAIVARICDTVEVPVTIDFEGGFASDPGSVAENVRRVLRAGAIGINFEDRIVQGEGLYAIRAQADRIAAIRSMAEAEGVPLFINARTDLFLESDAATHGGHLSEAIDRGDAYRKAGADCLFVPGLTDPQLISDVVARAKMPVNVMMMGDLQSIEDATALGVSRISFGPGPFLKAQADLRARYQQLK